MHEVRLDLDFRAVRKLANLDLLVAVRRNEEHDLGAARRNAAPGHFELERLLVKFHGAFEIIHAHPGMEKFFDHARVCMRAAHRASCGSMALDLATVRAAHERIRPHISRTPVLTNARLNAACGGKLFFKCENLQKVGSFKARGATNAVFSLADVEALRGVATHSSGNHAAAVARAAKLRGIPAHIVMPSNSAKPKIRAVEGYGGKITFSAPTQAAREEVCARILEETLATLIHPYEDERVMAGQGTAVIELIEEVRDLDI